MSTDPMVAHTRRDLAEAMSLFASDKARVAFVPTMGALHDGHRSLIAQARKDADVTVVSIFVNPLQFSPTEDLATYPRNLEADLCLCKAEHVDLVYAPTQHDVYPNGRPLVTVDPGPLGTVLEGESRPGHFAGVLTVVAKFFGLIRPKLAYFGEKDYQQLVLIRQLVEDLELGVGIVAMPTVRESDGLALSSRNKYLSALERRSAQALSVALRAGEQARDKGADHVIAAARAVLENEPGVVADYVALRAPDLSAVRSGRARLLIAARVGATRLIDNAELLLGEV